LESGPLSEVLDAQPVREAAEPFARVLVRVPEAYPLLGPFEATRPGLLVLDADGRRVDARALKEGDDPAEVATWIRRALEAPARERFRLRVRPGPGEGTAAGFAAAAAKAPGVLRAEAKGEEVEVLAKSGELPPEALARLAAAAKVQVEILEPVPVALAPGKDADPIAASRGLARAAGTWYVAEEKERLRAFVTRLLLDPAVLRKAAPAHEPDVEARRYAIPGVSPGPPGMKVAQAVQALPGVLAVVPDLAVESVTVVGRRGEAAWASVLEALRGVVPGAAEKP